MNLLADVPTDIRAELDQARWHPHRPVRHPALERWAAANGDQEAAS